MSFACRPDMLDETRVLGNYTLNPQSSVQRVVRGGSSARHHSVLSPVLARPARKHGVGVEHTPCSPSQISWLNHWHMVCEGIRV